MLANRIVTVCALATSVAAQEIALPAFDASGIQASAVLSLPATRSDEPPAWLVDFHGAIHPSQKGAVVTRKRLWAKFVERAPFTVLGLNSRTRAWGMVKGEKNDVAYALAAIDKLTDGREFDPKRCYLAGFSSGSDFLCKGVLQATGKFAGSLVVCPGPPNVVGLRNGELLAAKDHPFYFVTGEEDYVRKAGAWQAFVALDQAGGTVMYRQVPKLGHAFPAAEESQRALHRLQVMVGRRPAGSALDTASAASERGDYLLASSLLLLAERGAPARDLLAAIEARGTALLREAERIDFAKEPGRALEAWWRLRTQFHRFPNLAKRAQAELDKERGMSGRELMWAKRNYFRVRRGLKAQPLPGGRKHEPAPTPARRATRDSQPSREQKVARPASATGDWAFDRYLSFDEVEARLRKLAADNPGRVRLRSIGKSVRGRDVWVAEITARGARKPEDKPAIWVQAGIHGNEISAVMTALFFAWQTGANPDRRRAIDRILRDVTLYVAPAVNPDAVQSFVTEPNTLWRPRYNFRPHDADGDGRVDEDGYDDLDGDGQIGQMYAADPDGPFVLRNGRLVRDSTGKVTPRYRHVAREGRDDDGDGRFSEDPPGGVDLNRNFPVGHKVRREREGFRGTGPASEPEVAAIVEFVRRHPNIALFLDYHNAANCVFYWIGPDGQTKDSADFASMTGLASRAREVLGYAPRPLAHDGAGLSIAWAYGARGIPAAIVELEAGRMPEARYHAEVWKGAAFVAAKPFDHPQLGPILLGGDFTKLAKRNPHPSDIWWLVDRNWDSLRAEAQRLPKLVVDQPRFVPSNGGFVVTGTVRNAGKMPFATTRATRLGIAERVAVSARGARVTGQTSLPPLEVGQSAPFRVELRNPDETVILRVAHPRGGAIELEVRQPRAPFVAVGEQYDIPAGYTGVEDAIAADNDHFARGKPSVERGPVFKLSHRKKALRLAVLLGEFADRKHTVPVAAFREALFSNGGFRGTSPTGQPAYGSLRDFYREMSYGRVDVEGRVFDWLQVPGKWDDYRKASFGSTKFRAALEAAVLREHGGDALDGYDGIAFLWAGNPVHRVSNLWPMRVPLKHRPGVVAFKTGELYRGQMAPIGIACHELGHTFGVNDKYGLGAPAKPLGMYCLMCKGTHGAGRSGRHRPLSMCAWCRMVIGWLEPTAIDPSTSQKLALRPTLSSPRECYRILLEADGSEYLLLENRRREGFASEQPSAGLIVLRVGPNTRPSAPQKQVQLLPAHGLPPVARSDVAAPERVAWPQHGKTELVVGGVRLSGIKLVGDVLCFEVGPARQK